MTTLTVSWIAKELQVIPETVRRWLRDSKLKGNKFSGIWVIKEADYQRFIGG